MAMPLRSENRSKDTLARSAGCYTFVEQLDLRLASAIAPGDEVLLLKPDGARQDGRDFLIPGQFVYLGHGVQEARMVLEVRGEQVRVAPVERAYPANSPVLRPAQYQMAAA